MRRIPPLSAVRVFEAAARHQNFTAAAAELGMTQAAVSYQIRLLEERLGLPLFARARGRVELTEAGRRASPLVSAGLDNIADAFAGVLADDDAVLAVSTTQTFASNWLAPRLGSFHINRPELAVRLHTDNRMVDFAKDEIDVGIRSISAAPDWPGLRTHFLFRLHASPLCTPEFARAHDLREPADLLRVPRLSPHDSWWNDWFRLAGVTVPKAPATGGIRFDTQAMEGNAAMSGAGAAMLTPMFWRAELESGRLVQLFDTVHLGGTLYWLAYPEYKRQQPKILAFREWLLGQMRLAAPAEAAGIFDPP